MGISKSPKNTKEVAAKGMTRGCSVQEIAFVLAVEGPNDGVEADDNKGEGVRRVASSGGGGAVAVSFKAVVQTIVLDGAVIVVFIAAEGAGILTLTTVGALALSKSVIF